MKMNSTSLVTLALSAFLSIVPPRPVSAQTFTPIVGNYQCGQFPNGAEFLVRTTTTGFELVRKSEVQALFGRERKILKQRLSLINELLDGFKASRVSTAKLISGANKILAKLFGDDTIPKELPPGEAEVKVLNLRQRILDRDAVLATIGDLIDNCGGLNIKKGKGTPVGVTIKPVSLASSREIFGGFVIYASKMKNKFSRKPTGYNVCLKLIFADGTETKLYTGFGDTEICGTGTLKFEGVPPVSAIL